jgi:peptidoglycan/xylan/chitin deacetylase (PgdA/CDA1 family)
MQAGLSAMVFMSGAQRKLCQTGVPIYTYHYLGSPPRQAHDPFLYVSTAQFDAQLARLREEQYHFASLTEALDHSSHGPRRVVITFDDGAANVCRFGLEPLARHGAKAIQFLVAGLIGGRNEWMIKHGDASERLMDIPQVRDWLAAGHDIGSHTTTHPKLTELTLEAAREEIVASKKRLEDMFGRPVRHFCYPGGKWNDALREVVAEAGYATACTTQFGVNLVATPPHVLRRIVPLTRSALLGKIVHRLRRRALRGLGA